MSEAYFARSGFFSNFRKNDKKLNFEKMIFLKFFDDFFLKKRKKSEKNEKKFPRRPGSLTDALAGPTLNSRMR